MREQRARLAQHERGLSASNTLALAQHRVGRGHVDCGGDNWAIAFNDDAVGGCGQQQGEGGARCNVEIGYWLGEPFWGRGVVTQVVRVLTAQAFERTEVTRVFAPVHADHPASMRVLQENGFLREAELRRSAVKGGRVIDRVQWARLRDEAA
jgi:RimJ/RimL family protein N-acetyltransferase